MISCYECHAAEIHSLSDHQANEHAYPIPISPNALTHLLR